MIYKALLKGTTRLLHHRDDVLAADEIQAWRENPANRSVKKNGDDRAPAWTWMSYLYHDGENLAIPSDVVMSCLRGGGSKVPKGRGSYAALTQSGLMIRDDFCEFRVNGKQIKIADIIKVKDEPFAAHIPHVRSLGFDLLIKRAVVSSSKHVRVRAMFPVGWTISFDVEVLDRALTHEVMNNVCEMAGMYCGVGDWRPGSRRPGNFGMFTAEIKRID